MSNQATFAEPFHLRALQHEADVNMGRVRLSFDRREIDEGDLWYWLDVYQRHWLGATARLAEMGLA